MEGLWHFLIGYVLGPFLWLTWMSHWRCLEKSSISWDQSGYLRVGEMLGHQHLGSLHPTYIHCKHSPRLPLAIHSAQFLNQHFLSDLFSWSLRSGHSWPRRPLTKILNPNKSTSSVKASHVPFPFNIDLHSLDNREYCLMFLGDPLLFRVPFASPSGRSHTIT